MRSIAAAVLLLSISAAAADRSAAAFTVGALRRDGIVVPFATFDGERWSDRWPAPEPNPTIPISVSSVPAKWWGAPGPREAWQAWIDGQPRSLRVIQPDAVDVHCTRQIGLRTDYQPLEPPPPWSVQPYPKDGLAVSPPHAIDPLAILLPAAPELLPLFPVVTDAFNRAERATAHGSDYPVGEKRRERDDPEIDAAYAYGTDPRVYYVESSRPYRGVNGSGCAIAFGTGWFVRAGGRFARLAMTVDLLSCNKDGATYMLPFGVMTIAGRTYWLAQFSGWDQERFVVVEIGSKDVTAVVNAWGGGC